MNPHSLRARRAKQNRFRFFLACLLLGTIPQLSSAQSGSANPFGMRRLAQSAAANDALQIDGAAADSATGSPLRELAPLDPLRPTDDSEKPKSDDKQPTSKKESGGRASDKVADSKDNDSKDKDDKGKDDKDKDDKDKDDKDKDDKDKDDDDLQKKFDKLAKDFAKLKDDSHDEHEKLSEKLDDGLEELGDDLAAVTSDPTYVRSGGRASMVVTGRIHADYWSFPNTSGAVPLYEGGDPQDRLGFRRVRFGVAGDLKDNMLYKIEMEFAGGFASEFRDVYLGWTDLPYLQTVLLGNQKRPYGLDHRNSSRYNIFLERPMIIEAFNQDARRLGLSSYGFSKDLRYNWQTGVFNQELVQATGNYIDDHYQLEWASRFASTVWYDKISDGRGYAHLGVSGTIADPNGFGTNNQARFRTRPEARSNNRWIDTGSIAGAEQFGLMGLEGLLNLGEWQFTAEYQNVWLNRANSVGNDLFFHGAYLQAGYFLTGEHIPWDRESATLDRVKPFQNFWAVRRCDGCLDSGWGAWQVAARYSYSDFSDDNIFGGVGSAMTLGLNWHWNPTARMQFNYIYGEIHDRIAAGNSGDYSIFGTRFMVDF